MSYSSLNLSVAGVNKLFFSSCSSVFCQFNLETPQRLNRREERKRFFPPYNIKIPLLPNCCPPSALYSTVHIPLEFSIKHICSYFCPSCFLCLRCPNLPCLFWSQPLGLYLPFPTMTCSLESWMNSRELLSLSELPSLVSKLGIIIPVAQLEVLGGEERGAHLLSQTDGCEEWEDIRGSSGKTGSVQPVFETLAVRARDNRAEGQKIVPFKRGHSPC